MDEANRREIYIAILPSWGRWVTDNRNGRDDRILTKANAKTYGEFLGKRYGQRHHLGASGGRTAPVSKKRLADVRQGHRHRGVRQGGLRRGHDELPSGGGGTSSIWFHNDAWLDFNMHQTGHGLATKHESWARIAKDYEPPGQARAGRRGHCMRIIRWPLRSRENGYAFDAHVRQRAWWDIFSGRLWPHLRKSLRVGRGCARKAPRERARFFYRDEAIHRPGADQMQHSCARWSNRGRFSLRTRTRATVSRRPYWRLDHISASRGDGYAFVYSAQGRRFTVNLGKISGQRVNASWYNPRTGDVTSAG